MAVVYNTTLKNTRMTDVVTAIGATGVLQIGTSGMGTVLAEIPLANPAGTVSGGVLTFTMPQSDTSANATGTAAEARIRTASGGTDIVTGLTVSTSGANINLSSTSITAGDTVTMSSATITHG
jgi:hypothetical protein